MIAKMSRLIIIHLTVLRNCLTKFIMKRFIQKREYKKQQHFYFATVFVSDYYQEFLSVIIPVLIWSNACFRFE
jgi:hypothetical protein